MVRERDVSRGRKTILLNEKKKVPEFSKLKVWITKVWTYKSSSKISPMKFWKYLLESSYCDCWYKSFEILTPSQHIYESISELVGAGMWDICCSNPFCGIRSVWLWLSWMNKAVAAACSPCVPGLSRAVYLIWAHRRKVRSKFRPGWRILRIPTKSLIAEEDKGGNFWGEIQRKYRHSPGRLDPRKSFWLANRNRRQGMGRKALELGACGVCMCEMRKEKAGLLPRKEETGLSFVQLKVLLQGQRSKKWTRIRIIIKGWDWGCLGTLWALVGGREFPTEKSQIRVAVATFHSSLTTSWMKNN